jgi:hypothetical protein
LTRNEEEAVVVVVVWEQSEPDTSFSSEASCPQLILGIFIAEAFQNAPFYK